MRRNDISMTDMSDIDTGDNLYHVRKSRLIRLINWWQVRQGGRVVAADVVLWFGVESLRLFVVRSHVLGMLFSWESLDVEV